MAGCSGGMEEIPRNWLGQEWSWPFRVIIVRLLSLYSREVSQSLGCFIPMGLPCFPESRTNQRNGFGDQAVISVIAISQVYKAGLCEVVFAIFELLDAVRCHI